MGDTVEEASVTVVTNNDHVFRTALWTRDLGRNARWAWACLVYASVSP